MVERIPEKCNNSMLDLPILGDGLFTEGELRNDGSENNLAMERNSYKYCIFSMIITPIPT